MERALAMRHPALVLFRHPHSLPSFSARRKAYDATLKQAGVQFSGSQYDFACVYVHGPQNTFTNSGILDSVNVESCYLTSATSAPTCCQVMPAGRTRPVGWFAMMLRSDLTDAELFTVPAHV